MRHRSFLQVPHVGGIGGETVHDANSYVLCPALDGDSASARLRVQLGPSWSYQEAPQFLPKGCSRKMPPSFSLFEWGRLLEHSFLEHFCLDQFSVILGKFYRQDSRTPRLVEHFRVPILGASCSNKLFVGTVRPSHLRSARHQRAPKSEGYLNQSFPGVKIGG